MTTYFHATTVDNFAKILQDGFLAPSIDGCVHLTTNKDKALRMVASRGVKDVAIFYANLDDTMVTAFIDGDLSGDDCYVHEGQLSGIALLNIFKIA